MNAGIGMFKLRVSVLPTTVGHPGVIEAHALLRGGVTGIEIQLAAFVGSW